MVDGPDSNMYHTIVNVTAETVQFNPNKKIIDIIRVI